MANSAKGLPGERMQTEHMQTAAEKEGICASVETQLFHLGRSLTQKNQWRTLINGNSE